MEKERCAVCRNKVSSKACTINSEVLCDECSNKLIIICSRCGKVVLFKDAYETDEGFQCIKCETAENYTLLAEYCHEHFDIWFNKKLFPKEEYWYLAKYCSDHFDKWFDKETLQMV